MARQQFPESAPGLSRRSALSSLVLGTAALGAACPSLALARTTGPARPMSSFGRNGAAVQQAFDWAHETRGTLVLDADATVDRTVFLGHLRLVDAGGVLRIASDKNFRIARDTGSWGGPKGAAIVMRSSPRNQAYGDPSGTRYLVTIERGVRIDYRLSSPSAPCYPMRFVGLAPGSLIAPDFTGLVTFAGECNGPDWYWFNHCRIGGTYRLQFTQGDPHGGFWLRDRDYPRLGSDYGSDFVLENPVFAKIGGSDECLGIFTSRDEPGYLRARGSVTVAQSDGIGFSVFNWARTSRSDFDVALDKVTVRATIRDGQPVVKIDDDYTTIAEVDATVTGLRPGFRRSAVLRCSDRPGRRSAPRVGLARLSSEGGGSAGYPGVAPVVGTCDLGGVSVVRVRPPAR